MYVQNFEDRSERDQQIEKTERGSLRMILHKVSDELNKQQPLTVEQRMSTTRPFIYTYLIVCQSRVIAQSTDFHQFLEALLVAIALHLTTVQGTRDEQQQQQNTP